MHHHHQGRRPPAAPKWWRRPRRGRMRGAFLRRGRLIPDGSGECHLRRRDAGHIRLGARQPLPQQARCSASERAWAALHPAGEEQSGWPFRCPERLPPTPGRRSAGQATCYSRLWPVAAAGTIGSAPWCEPRDGWWSATNQPHRRLGVAGGHLLRVDGVPLPPLKGDGTGTAYRSGASHVT